MDADKPVEIFLASIWKYQDAGISHVLDTLNHDFPGCEITFDKANGWFRVVCSAKTLHSIQITFRTLHEEMERDIGRCSVPPSNKWLEMPTPTDLSLMESSVASKTTAVDHQCPASFDQYSVTKVWTSIKDKTPDTTTVYELIGAEEKDDVLAKTGVHMAFDAPGRLVYLGGPTHESLHQACKMLDNLFSRFLFEMPQARHVLYAEVEPPYNVDVRHMAHVNNGMLTSTILDPGQYLHTQLDQTFQEIFAKAACLRICLYDPFKRGEVSLFGPKAQPVFHHQARRWPLWFQHTEYAPKVLGVTALRKEALPAGRGTTKGLNPVDVNRMESQADLPAVGKLSLNKGLPEASVTTTPVASVSVSPVLRSPYPAAVEALPPLDETGEHDYQMKLLLEFMNSANARAREKPRPQPAALVKAVAADTLDGKITGYDNTGDAVLIDVGLQAAGQDTKEITDLITLDEPPQEANTVSAVPVLPTSRGNDMSNALVRRSALTDDLNRYLGQLTADLPYRNGRIRVQAELGRIYIMDASSEGLAFNTPGTFSNGWAHTEIMTRLDTICVSPGSVMFTKALSIFANDIEALIGSAANTTACTTMEEGRLPASPPTKNFLDDTGSTYSGLPSEPVPEWRFHDKRIMYELKCQRFLVGNNGTAKAQAPFIVEIDGTEPNAFKYSIRHMEDTRPPIWVHCLRRHWDVRLLVMYSNTNKLEKAYGDFARELIRTMVVPPGPMTNPRFQIAFDHRQTQKDGRSYITKVQSARVRNVGRFVDSTDETYFDVSWNRHMQFELKPDKEDLNMGILRATPATDDASRGLFTSWYEAAMVSVRAEEAFNENVTLSAGDEAAWGRSKMEQEEIFRATFGPALQMVQKMDGVGVLIDNGLGDTLWTPPMLSHVQQIGHTSDAITTKFW